MLRAAAGVSSVGIAVIGAMRTAGSRTADSAPRVFRRGTAGDAGWGERWAGCGAGGLGTRATEPSTLTNMPARRYVATISAPGADRGGAPGIAPGGSDRHRNSPDKT